MPRKTPQADEAKVKKSPSNKDRTSGVNKRLKGEGAVPEFKPTNTERIVGRYVEKRSHEMMEFRKNLNIEQRWKQADEEYVPHELDFGTTRKRFETDQDTGLRSRMVPVGDATQQWRQASSAPTLLSKIQTAVSIIVNNQPEGNLTALLKKYQATTALAYSLWKRNWAITDAREKLKVIIFNLIKYGWGPQRTYPRKVAYKKRVLTEKDPENPENDKYEEKELVWFHDVDREPLNPYRTWIDELTKPYDVYSMNEAYFEVDYSYDTFMVEFGHYPNAEFVPRDSAMQRSDEQPGSTNRQTVARSQSVTDQAKVRKDIVTVGFFESRTKDLYVLYIPRHKIVLYQSPMPNDDGYLSVTQTMWMFRSANLPYGISLWEVIRQNKALYDKMKNMTMDQLVLSIMKFGFFSGTSTTLGDGKIPIVPGQARQLTSSTGKPEVNWMDIPGPGEEAWKGLEFMKSEMDDESGINSFVEGNDTPGNQTLGEVLHNKESALKRLKLPVDNIAWLIEQDAYLTLSWMSQLYAMPTIIKFADEKELVAYEKEEQVQHTALFADFDEEGKIKGDLEAHFLPQLALHLAKDEKGNLAESKDSQFFQVGKDILPKDLRWKGVFKVIPRSIIDSSQELMKASKSEMFNMLVPLFQFPPQIVGKAVQQILKINEEDPEDWLPDNFVAYLKGEPVPEPEVPGAGETPAINPEVAGGGTMQEQAGTGEVKPPPTVVPKGQVTPASENPLGNGAGKALGVFNRRI